MAKWSSPTIRHCQSTGVSPGSRGDLVPMASSNGTKVAAVRALRRNAMPGRLASFAEDSRTVAAAKPDEHR